MSGRTDAHRGVELIVERYEWWAERSPHFGVDARLVGPCTLFSVSGDLDVAARPAMRLALRHVPVTSAHLAVDLRELAFIDAAGLGALVEAANQVRGRQGRLTLRVPAGFVRRVLTIGGLSALVEPGPVCTCDAPGTAAVVAVDRLATSLLETPAASAAPTYQEVSER